MKKLLLIMLLFSPPSLAQDSYFSITPDEFTKIETKTDNFFMYCIKNIDTLPMFHKTYCIGYYKGLSMGWVLSNVSRTKCATLRGTPSFADFSIKFSSLFYRNKINTLVSTPENIYITLDEFCDIKANI